MAKYIHQREGWSNFSWDSQKISNLLAEVRNLQGRLMGKMAMLGFDVQAQSTLDNITLDILKSSEIEGEKLNRQQVRSSLARRLGIDFAGMVDSSHDIDGLVEMMLDATQHYEQPLTEERLFGWHAALFPTAHKGPYKIDAACYRKGEMDKFLYWLNHDNSYDNVLKAAIAHRWFIFIHPFDNGNGRIARAISDMLLARSDDSPQRFYSMSAQINKERKAYYKAIEKSEYQTDDSDMTLWMLWFLQCLKNALLASEKTLQSVMRKAAFWANHPKSAFNERQVKMLNLLFDGSLRGKMQSSKWAKMCKCSQDTATRDIKALMEQGLLQQEEGGGRSTSYRLADGL